MAFRFSRSIRTYDFLGRWGGEEFLFILRDSTELQACETMERIRVKTTEEPVECSGLSLHVTLTIGVAHYRPGDTKASLFDRADQLLYQGKETGKNRVMSDLL